MNSHSESNRLKALSGKQITDLIIEKLIQLKKEGIISSFNQNVNFRHQGYKYDSQYLANFIINTIDEKNIVVRSSNSFRGDRAKIGFYDIAGIVSSSDYSDKIISSIYLVSETELDNPDFVNIRNKIRNGDYYCPATHLFVLSEFISFLQTYSDEQKNILVDIQEENKFKSLAEAGSFYGIKGNKVEKDIAELFSDEQFLQDYISGKSTSRYKIVIDTILEKNHINKENLLAIRATNSIPLLASGGNPKSDIFLEILTLNQNIIKTTISVKNTDKKIVTCHDYKAEDFIRVLKCKDTRLAEYLELFQKFPSYSGFKDNLPESYSEKEFSELMQEKRKILSEWCLRGFHDAENIVDPQKQISNFILINTSETAYFYEMEEYINFITNNTPLVFSTPFSWTYPSKQRGKRIQLKMPIFYSIIS